MSMKRRARPRTSSPEFRHRMFSPAIGDGSWPSYLAARVRANDAAVILCAQKLTSWQLREDLTDLKRDECKSAYGVHSGRTSYRLLAVQTVLPKGRRRTPDKRNWTASQQPNIARMLARPSRPKGSVRTASPTQCPPPPGEAKKSSSSAPNVRKPGITWLSQVLKKKERKKEEIWISLTRIHT